MSIRTRYNIFKAIHEERDRQEDKWGEENVIYSGNDPVCLAVLTEEVGEVAKAILERNAEEVETELIQVAAVAVAWLEAIHRNSDAEVPQNTTNE